MERGSPERNDSSPLQIAAFAARHPKVTVILGHGGLHDLWKEAIVAADRTANLYLAALANGFGHPTRGQT
jgi:predicted TIM-barrel fold metal-dependent hydrolase